MSDSFSSDTSRHDDLSVDLLGTGVFSPLVEAFLQGRELDLLAPVRFLGPDQMPPEACAETNDRSRLAEALATTNERVGHPRAAELAQRLADPATGVVITGQQPGLFGGPLYTLSKAVAAELWAQRLSSAGRPSVALFWVATEDHDFLESSRAWVPSPDGLTQVDLGADLEPLKPVGSRVLGAPVEAALASLEGTMPGERYQQWLRRLGEWYEPRARFGDAFAQLMIHLLGERCPLLVDAMLPTLKESQRPWLRRLVERRSEVAQALEARDRMIENRGFDLQVTPQPGSSPLFLHRHGERRRIEWRGDDRFALRGDEEYEASVDRLLDIIEQEPSRVSPGVRARSAIQDAVFGTCLEILGPGELSYLPQVAPLFDLLEITPPLATLRPQVLVLDGRQRSWLEEIGIPLETLLAPGLDVDAWLARPEDTAFLDEARAELEATFERMQPPAVALDAGLERPLEKTAGQIRKAMGAFSERVKAAAARRDEVRRNRLGTLRDHCLPEGRLQERVVVASHFPGKYGDAFVEAMFEQMELEPTKLRVVSP